MVMGPLRLPARLPPRSPEVLTGSWTKKMELWEVQVEVKT